MAFYIPYFVGASVASYLTKNMYNYMVSDDSTIIETSNITKENPFLKITDEPIILEPIILDIMEPNKDNKLETIMEHTETTETKETIVCSKCKLYLPSKCFSKNQFKKYKKSPTCKVCTKLG